MLLVLAVPVTCISDKNSSLLNGMAMLSIGCAHIYIVFVIQTSADHVSFHNEITHDDMN